MATMVKKGKHYHGVFYVDGRHVWRSLKTSNEHEARNRLRQLEIQLEGGGFLVGADLTVGEFFELWFDLHVMPNLSPSTAQSYISNSRLHILPKLGHIKLSDLTTVHVQSFIAEKVREGVLSKTSIGYLYRILRSALTMAVEWEYVHKNVAK